MLPVFPSSNGFSEAFKTKRRKTLRRRAVKKNAINSAAGLEALEERVLLANYTVDLLTDEADTNNGAGDLSLREAIILSNANGEADTIELPAGLIQLSLPNNNQENASATGDLDVTESFQLKIVGQGMGVTIIDGGDIDRVLHVHPNAELVLEDLTIQNGLATDNGSTGSSGGPGHGGGILANQAALTLNNVEVLNSEANGSTLIRNARGAGIYAISSDVEINNSSIRGNSATAINGALNETGGFSLGGGLYLWQSNVDIMSSEVLDNSVTGGAGSDGDGSAVANPGGSALGGGIYSLQSDLNVQYSTVAGNSATGAEGGAGRPSLADIGGSAGRAAGGGIHISASTASLDTLAILNNTVVGGNGGDGGGFNGSGGAGGDALGAGLFTDVAVDVSNATISGNVATAGPGGTPFGSGASGVPGSSVGGGVDDDGGSTLTGVTITANTADAGAGIDGTGTTINNSIIAQNAADNDVSGNIGGTSDAVLIGNTDGAASLPFGGALNQFGSATGSGVIDAKLGPLSNNGGPTLTHLPATDSPAQDAGDNTRSVGLTDQRGADRMNGTVDLGSIEVQTPDLSALSLVITTAEDELDWAGNDSTLETMGGANDLSLREALILANINPTLADTITFATGPGEAFENPTTITLDFGPLEIAGPVSINANQAATLVIDAAGLSRALTISGPAAVDLASISFINGNSSGDGGAIQAAAGSSLSVLNAEISANSGSRGGAIFAEGDLTLANVTVAGNTSAGNGGAIFVGGTTADLSEVKMANVTIDGNTATGSGAGLFAEFADLVIDSSTITGNTSTSGSGGGLAMFGAEADVTNSVVGLNSAVTNDDATVSSDSKLNAAYAFFSTTVALSGASNNNLNGGGDPQLAPLAMNGGPVQTRAPLETSPLLDAGKFSHLIKEVELGLDVDGDGTIATTQITNDARSVDRVMDVLEGGAIPDMGAFERQQLSSASSPMVITVTTTADELDSVAPDATLELLGGAADISLREAVLLANQNSMTEDTIQFDAVLFDGEPGNVLSLTLGELDVSGPIVLDGNGLVEISGQGASRILNFSTADATATLDGLTLSGGAADSGAAVLSVAPLTIVDSVIQNNAATGTDIAGGAVAANAGLTLLNSLVSENTATGSTSVIGGGIYVSGGDAIVAGSTIANNSIDAPAEEGSGLAVIGGNAVLINVTLADNSHGGLYGPGASIDIDSSTITGNAGYGVRSDSSGALEVTNSLILGNINDSGLRRDINGISATYSGNSVVGPTLIQDGIPVSTNVTASDVFESTSEIFIDDVSTGYFSGVLKDSVGPHPTVPILMDGLADAGGALDSLPLDLADLDADGDTSEVLPLDANGNPRFGGGMTDMGAVQAADTIDLMVTTLDDIMNIFDGVTSLREAINLANDPTAGTLADGDADDDGSATDAIVFSSALAGGTLRLQLGEIEISAPLVLNSTETESILISGDTNGNDVLGSGDFTSVIPSQNQNKLGDNTRLFNVTDPAAALTINALSLTGGRTTGDSESGAAIFSLADVTLNDVTLRGNSTSGNSSSGGGVYATNVTMTGGQVRDNVTNGDAALGGAIYASGAVSITDVTLRDNKTFGMNAHGGAVYADTVEATIAFVRRNATTGDNSDGAGLYAASSLTVTDALINENVTTGVGSDGGGLASAGTLLAENVLIEFNQTQGADATGAGAFAASLNLVNVSVSQNSTIGDGAHGAGVAGDNVALTNATIFENTTAGLGAHGAGVYSAVDVSAWSATITGNSTAGDQSTGGGLHAAGAGTLANSLITGNVTQFAGVAADNLAGTPTLAGGNLVGGTLTSGSTIVTSGILPGDVFESTVEVLADADADGVPETATGIFAGKAADNGGDVYTIALLAMDTNPVLDAGDAGTLPTDIYDLDNDADTSEPLSKDARRKLRTIAAMTSAAPDLGAIELQEGSRTFVVKVAADELEAADTSLSTYNANDLSLREAITLANLDSGFVDTITFKIGGGGFQAITITSALPTLTERIVIDGTSQSGYTDFPLIGLDGLNAGAGTHGLEISSTNSSVSGLAIYNFDSDGIAVTGGSEITIFDNYIGLDTAGNAAGNGLYGVRLIEASDVVIDGNVISSNGKSGVLINTESNNNIVSNNTIGTNIAGDTALPNLANGVHILKSADNQVLNNHVAGNRRNGITIGGTGATNNNVIGNTVGTTADGMSALANGEYGIWVRRGTQLISDNLSSGNGLSGIVVAGGITDNNIVSNNIAGTNIDGTAAIPNERSGIIVFAGTGNTVQDNIASGNLQRGILVSGNATGTMILDNTVGTSADGMTAIPNTLAGVRIQDASTQTLVSGNLISANGGAGVLVTDAGSDQNVIQSNIIGTTADESALLPNVGIAVEVRSADNTIGGSAADANVIAGSSRGVLIAGSLGTGNLISHNFIGIDSSETQTDYGNIIGVLMNNGASDNAVMNNVVAYNQTGVRIHANSGTGNMISDNSIYANSAIGIELANTGTTENDELDADEDGNRSQNTPVIMAAISIDGSLEVDYYVDSTAASSTWPLTIEFFLAGDDEQGRTLLATDTYEAADAGVMKSVVLDDSNGEFAGGTMLVATATDASGNTSEFSVGVEQESVAPTASLTSPESGSTADLFTINADGYLDVTFTDASGINPATIDGDEISLSGTGLGTVVLDGTAELQDGTTYRYAFTGEFADGDVTVEFAAASFTDWASNPNEPATETFAVELESIAPLADLVSPVNLSPVLASALNATGYIDVAFSDEGGGLDLASIDGDEIVLGGSGMGTAVLAGTAVLQQDSTYRYEFTGEFVPGLVTITFAAGSFMDIAANPNAEEIESFVTQESTPPTVDLTDPLAGATLSQSVLNQRGYIDVTFSDATELNSGVNYETINGDEISFTGDGAGTAAVFGAPTQLSGNTWRYTIGGGFDFGNVDVVFNAATFTDIVGNLNVEETESFYLEESTPPTADLDVPQNGAGVLGNVINELGYIDVAFSDADSGLDATTIDGDELTLGGAGLGDVVLTGSPTFVADDVWRYAFTGAFVDGQVTVTFNADSFADQFGNLSESEVESFTVITSNLFVTVTNDELDEGDVSLDSYDPDDLSLREALVLVNELELPNARIGFNIAGSGPHIFDITSPLPQLSAGVILDGMTDVNYVGTPVIGINGASAGLLTDGLQLTAADSAIRGLAIYGFGGNGIEISGNADNVEISNNYVGLTPDGTPVANVGNGIRIVGTEDNTVINNVVAGNGLHGIMLEDADGTLVSENTVGTNPAGDAAIGNLLDGVHLLTTSSATIDGNLISANTESGIQVAGGLDSTANVITNNLIGTNAAGDAPLGNGTAGIKFAAFGNFVGDTSGNGNVIAGSQYGVWFTDNSLWNNLDDNFIGTDASGTNTSLGNVIGVLIEDGANNQRLQENLIANGANGVRITSSAGVGNKITRNSITNQTALGIDIALNGATPNDAGDVDEGANRIQNYPDITSATVVNDEIQVTYSVDSSPATTAYPIQVQFFLVDESGSGAQFIGSANHGSAEAGASLTQIVSSGGTEFANGNAFVAIAIDALGNTSEFTPAVTNAGGSGGGSGAASSGSAAPISFLDVNADGETSPLVDGILILRHLAGFRGDALTDGIVTDEATRAAVADYFAAANLNAFDIDGDGSASALGDGMLVLRHLAGFQGEALVDNAVNDAGTRSSSDAIQQHLETLQSATVEASFGIVDDEIDSLFSDGNHDLLDA